MKPVSTTTPPAQAGTTTLTINNKRVYDFYTANPHINIESMNLVLLDLIEQLHNDISKLSAATATGEILACVREIHTNMTSLGDTLAFKLHDHNKSFVETTKLVIGMASSENTDKIIQALNRNTDSFIERIHSSIPKMNDESNRKIQQLLSDVQLAMQSDIRAVLEATKGRDDGQDRGMLDTLETRLSQQQQPLFAYLTANQDQLISQIAGIRETAIVGQAASDKIHSELNEFLGKYRSSSQFKGQCSENMLETVLNKLYPTADVANTTATKASGDFVMKREDRPIIMIENKNYERNVNLEEVKKFLRDVTELRCSGIMISQFSGIASKPNGFIEVHDANVLVYLHNVDYSPEKIKMAVDVIDNLTAKLETIAAHEEQSGIVIRKDVLDRINEQFQFFMAQKETLLGVMRDSHKKIISQIEELRLPDLSAFLNDKYASIQNQQFVCDVCNLSFTNRRSLASHRKLHKNKPGATEYDE
jgi:hypothetical protein